MSADFPSYLKSIQAQLENNKPSVTTTNEVSSSVTTSSSDSTKKDALRFMLVSTHLHQFTGYSRVSHNLLKQLSKIPEISLIHYGFQKIPEELPNYRPYPSNVEVIDAVTLEQPPGSQQGFGFTALPDMIRKKKPHIVMIYNDMSVITKFLEEIRKSGLPRTFKIWLYVDQVYNCQLDILIDVINRDADRVFTFSSYWKKCLKDQGVNRQIDIIHHGFDKSLYFTVPREMVRKQMGLPLDAFLFICLNRNQPRKRYDILIMAFVELIVKNPQKPLFLLCVCDKGEKGGWILQEIFKRELKLRGVPLEPFLNRLLLSTKDMSFRDEEINLFYNVADVGVSTSDGEGWGLCNFEQMGVGVPQIVPHIGGFKEFCNANNSILVKPKSKYYLPLAYSVVGGEAEACDPHDVCLAMEEYVFDSTKREAFGKAAKEKVLTYTWENAVESLVKRILDTRKELMDDGEL